MKTHRSVMMAVALTLAIAVAAAGVAVAAAQTKCPVMGGDIDKRIYADHDGKRVYFCCPYCVGEFEKNPKKYIDKLEKQGIVLDKAPK